MEFNYADILSTHAYLVTASSIPSDLTAKVLALSDVKRFQFKEYPPNVIVDNTFTHVLKCIHLTHVLQTHLNQTLLERILWIHDIPELTMGDVTVIEKSRSSPLNKRLEAQELVISKSMLSSSDQILLQQFNTASTFLKGQHAWDPELSCFEALLAKLIDNAEGNMTFHYFITQWVNSDKFAYSLMPPTDSLIHTFVSNQRFKSIIQDTLPEEQALVASSLIKCVLENVLDMWNTVPLERVPSAIIKYL